jgi:hypothetical protein
LFKRFSSPGRTNFAIDAPPSTFAASWSSSTTTGEETLSVAVTPGDRGGKATGFAFVTTVTFSFDPGPAKGGDI